MSATYACYGFCLRLVSPMIGIFSKRRIPFLIAAIVCAATLPAKAQPSPPPDMAAERAIRAESCPQTDVAEALSQVAIKVQSVPVDAIGGKDGAVGDLSYRWGLRLTSSDARFGGITGLMMTEKYGLVALTDRGVWIILGFAHDDLQSNKVGIAPVRGLEGSPATLGDLGSGRILVSVPDRHSVSRFEIGSCGLAARAVPIFQYDSDARVTAITTVVYGYTLFAGSKGIAETYADAVLDPFNTFLYPTRPSSIRLDQTNVPNLAGYKLVAAASTAFIVPYGLIGLWRPVDGRTETVVSEFNLPQWSDVRPKIAPTPRPPKILARIPLAVTAVQAQGLGNITMILASHAALGEPTYLFGLDRNLPEH